MATRRRGVKHTRRHHAKTKKKLSKRYRGKKGYSKRITRRHRRRSHDTDIINTQDGGNLTIWSAAKTAAGKALELKLISRYLLKNANKTINDYVVSQGINLEKFYTFVGQRGYTDLPLNVRNAVEIYVNVIKLSHTAEHDLPHEIVEQYKKTFTTPEDSGNADILFTDTDPSVGNIEHYDETEFKDEKLKIFKSVDGHVSIKAKKIEHNKSPESASIDSGDAYRFLTNIFYPSDVPFIMIVVFYTQLDYIFPQLKSADIQMLSESGVTTTGEPRPGNIIFVRKIVKINMTRAKDEICGGLTEEEKKDILTRLLEASMYVKSPIETKRVRGQKICESVDVTLQSKSTLLRVSVKNNSNYKRDRIQARLLVNLKQLAKYCEVDDTPAVSPIFGASSSPLVSASLNMSFSEALDATRQLSERTGPTSFSKKIKPENIAGKSPEEIGTIVVEAMRKDANFANFFKRIYNTSSGSKKSRPGASHSTRPASAGRKLLSAPRSTTPSSAPRSMTPASASKTPSASASRKGAISRAPASIPVSIYASRIFPPTRSSTRGKIFLPPAPSSAVLNSAPPNNVTDD